MPVQAPDPLQQHIHRAKVGDQQVGAQIQALFQSLSADHDPAPQRAVLADGRLDGAVQKRAILGSEAAVVQRRTPRDGQEEAGLTAGGEGLLCAGHRVPDHKHTGPFARRLYRQTGGFVA